MNGLNHSEVLDCEPAASANALTSFRGTTAAGKAARTAGLTSVVVLRSEVLVHIGLAQLNVDLEPSMTPAYRAHALPVTLRESNRMQHGRLT